MKIGFPRLETALVVARVCTPLFFMAHAAVRVLNGSIPQFGAFLEAQGFPAGTAIVWAITAYELLAGLMILVGYKTRYFALGFAGILLVGIALIHVQLGWFVGEHGTGGSEYSVALLVLLLVISAADASGVSKRARN